MGDKQEFLNPKSMLTPGIAGATTMMITNALYKTFGLPSGITALTISFVLGLLVFSSAVQPGWHKPIYYVFNSLIIFSMATGSHVVGNISATSDTGTKQTAATYSSTQKKTLKKEQSGSIKQLHKMPGNNSAKPKNKPQSMEPARDRRPDSKASDISPNKKTKTSTERSFFGHSWF